MCIFGVAVYMNHAPLVDLCFFFYVVLLAAHMVLARVELVNLLLLHITVEEKQNTGIVVG